MGDEHPDRQREHDDEKEHEHVEEDRTDRDASGDRSAVHARALSHSFTWHFQEKRSGSVEHGEHGLPRDRRSECLDARIALAFLMDLANHLRCDANVRWCPNLDFWSVRPFERPRRAPKSRSIPGCVDGAGLPALIEAIRHLHGCEATWVESVPVHETSNGHVVWDGEVQVFDVTGHPKATRVYAWSHATDGSRRRFHAVLALPPVTTPEMAVRTAIFAEAKRVVPRKPYRVQSKNSHRRKEPQRDRGYQVRTAKKPYDRTRAEQTTGPTRKLGRLSRTKKKTS